MGAQSPCSPGTPSWWGHDEGQINRDTSGRLAGDTKTQGSGWGTGTAWQTGGQQEQKGRERAVQKSGAERSHQPHSKGKDPRMEAPGRRLLGTSSPVWLRLGGRGQHRDERSVHVLETVSYALLVPLGSPLQEPLRHGGP